MMKRSRDFYPVTLTLFLVSLLFLTGQTQAQDAAVSEEAEAKRVEVITVPPDTPSINPKVLQGNFLYVQIFPAGQSVPANGFIQSNPVNIGGASRIVIRMLADDNGRNLTFGVFFGPLPPGNLFFGVNEEMGNFRDSPGQSLEFPVAAPQMILRLDNSSSRTRILQVGATVYAAL